MLSMLWIMKLIVVQNVRKDLKEPSKKVTATLSSRNYPDDIITKNRQNSKEITGIVGVACCHLIYSVSHYLLLF